MKKQNSKMIDNLLLKIIYKKRVGKSLMKRFFLFLRKQAVVNLFMASHVLPEGHFAKNIELVGKTFYFCELCDIYFNWKNWKKWESTRDHYENAKIHRGDCIRASEIFFKIRKIIVTEKNRQTFSSKKK